MCVKTPHGFPSPNATCKFDLKALCCNSVYQHWNMTLHFIILIVSFKGYSLNWLNACVSHLWNPTDFILAWLALGLPSEHSPKPTRFQSSAVSVMEEKLTYYAVIHCNLLIHCSKVHACFSIVLHALKQTIMTHPLSSILPLFE